jgi:hypothetical protein
MGYSVFPSASGGANLLNGWTAGVAGTFPITTLQAGVYRISMDTTQNLTFSFSSTDSAYEIFPAFTGSTRGGSGWVSLPYPMNRITVPAGSFPYSIVLERMDVTPPLPPTNPTITWNANKTQVTGTWSSIPADATGVRFYWKVGATTYSSPFSSTTSGATANISAGAAQPPANPSGITFGLVCTNSSGAAGTIVTGTTGAVPLATTTVSFNSSTTWTSPISGVLTQLLVVGGGGNGASSGVPGAGGAGGAGGYRTTTSQAVTQNTVYTITVGGANTGSSFHGLFSASAGGGGAGPGGNGGAGGSGGGGSGNGMSANGSGGAGNIGGYTPSEGNNGGGSSGTTGSGGGGGAGGGGSTGGGNQPGGAGVTNSITGSPVVYAQGGNGGAGSGSPSGPGFGGGGGGYNAGTPGGAGYAGIIIIQYQF